MTWYIPCSCWLSSPIVKHSPFLISQIRWLGSWVNGSGPNCTQFDGRLGMAQPVLTIVRFLPSAIFNHFYGLVRNDSPCKGYNNHAKICSDIRRGMMKRRPATATDSTLLGHWVMGNLQDSTGVFTTNKIRPAKIPAATNCNGCWKHAQVTVLCFPCHSCISFTIPVWCDNSLKFLCDFTIGILKSLCDMIIPARCKAGPAQAGLVTTMVQPHWLLGHIPNSWSHC